MSYALAYTTHFHSLDDTPWDIGIYINEYEGRAVEISLEADEPCVIEWQETSKADVVQASMCTLRVSNESDRQMVQLMGHTDAAVLVSRDGKWYWWGRLDDAVYEEPYSYDDGYVTELTFSDFGILNRIPFTLKGKQSVDAIVRDCLDSIGYGNGATINLYTSLLDPDTQQPVGLGRLYINADRFESGDEPWGEMTSKREVLEEILRPLGLRIMQQNAQIFIYDIEYLRDHDLSTPVAWKGTDAYLRGSGHFGRFEAAFEPDADETLAGGEADYDEGNPDDGRYYAEALDDEGHQAAFQPGFYINTDGVPSLPDATLPDGAVALRTAGVATDTADVCVAWAAYAWRTLFHINGIPQGTPCWIANGAPVALVGLSQPVLSVTSGYLPLTPDRGKYQLRVSLDFLLSFRPNPFDKVEQLGYNPLIDGLWKHYEQVWRQVGIRVILLPAKLELLDDDGQAVGHYTNADSEDIADGALQYAATRTCAPGQGRWVSGAADSFGSMMLAYYGDLDDDDDDDPDPIVGAEGWTTNRQTVAADLARPGIFASRADGEYLPMPSVAGRLRLTVGSGVFGFMPLSAEHSAGGLYAHGTYLHQLLTWCRWQMYRNPKIAIVRANRKADGIDTAAVYRRLATDPTGDLIGATLEAGCWQKGIAPSARGLLFKADGNVWEKFVKGGTARTLLSHRAFDLLHQTAPEQPVLAGTAELDTRFGTRTDNATPGTFLVTALRQDLHQDTEHVTMVRIDMQGGAVVTPPFEYEWSQQVCAAFEPPFEYEWSQQVCTARSTKLGFLWSGNVCAIKAAFFAFKWTGDVCALRTDESLEWQAIDPKPESD